MGEQICLAATKNTANQVLQASQSTLFIYFRLLDVKASMLFFFKLLPS